MKQNGFSFTEILIVLLAVAFITVIAVPSYNEHIVRSKINEVINLARLDLRQISDYMVEKGNPNNSSELAEMLAAIEFTAINSDIVTNETIDSYGLVITISGGTLPTGLSIGLRYVPTVSHYNILWDCAFDSTTTNTIDSNNSNSDHLYLPINCHVLNTTLTPMYA